ncbi:MAG: segregation/condensation protein A [bacterium]|nr:segregation/condensation protein A [bacterium]
MTYEVKLDKFSGPLGTLLRLIEEKQLEITLINLGKVTGDFLEYLKHLEEDAKHPSVLADFVVVASRLLLIKSKAILPSLELTEEEEVDIRDLEARLKIYKEFKNAGIVLEELWGKAPSFHGREFFANLPVVFYPSKNITIEALEAQILKLIKELKNLVPEKQNVHKIIITIESKVKELLERFKGQASHSFKTLSQAKPKIEAILLFLAILHLIRDRVITSQQDEHFSDIIITHEDASDE